MRRSSWYFGVLGAAAALAVAGGVAVGGYLVGRTVMASRLDDRFATVAGMESAAKPAAATAGDLLPRGEQGSRQTFYILRLLKPSECDDQGGLAI